MNHPLLYKQVYPKLEKQRRRKVENSYYDFHTGKIKNVTKHYYEDISSSEEQIGKKIAVFGIIFCQILCLQRRVFQIYDFCEKNLYYEIVDFIKENMALLKTNELFSNRNLKISRVIFHRYTFNKIHSCVYISDGDSEKFLCLTIEFDKISNDYKIKNIKFPFENRIKELGKTT